MSLAAQSTAETSATWKPCWNEESQLYYWWNVETGQTTWEDPNLAHSIPPPPPTEDVADKLVLKQEVVDQPVIKEEVDQPIIKQEVDDTNTEELSIEPNASPPPESDAEPHHSKTGDGQGVKSETAKPNSSQSQDSVKTHERSSDYYSSKAYRDWYYSVYLAGAGPQMSNTTYPPSSQGVVGTVDQSDYSVTGAFSTYTGKFQNVDRDARYAAPEQHFDQNSKAFRQMGFYFDTDKYQEERSQQRMEERMNPRKTQKLSKKDVEFYKQRKKEKKLRSLKARFGPD